MTTPHARPRRPSLTNRQIVLIGVVAVIILLLGSMRAIARAYTDFLWFDEVHYSSVWSAVIGAKVTLALIFIALAFLIVFINLTVARRIAPQATFLRPQDEAIRKFRETMRVRGRMLNSISALLAGILLGYPVFQKWQSWMLFRNATAFDVKDPQFGRDIGFYVFKLPFITFAVDWIFGVLLFTTVLLVVLYYLYGGIQVQSRTEKVTKGVRAHLSVLLGLLALTKAIDYYLQRYELMYAKSGFISGGAGYTDIKATLPALNFLVLIAVFAAVLFFVNIRIRRWSLPIIAVGLWLVVEVALAGIYPALVQKFRVQPAESTKEAPYIDRNIKATRAAYNLSDIERKEYAYADDVTPADLVKYKGTLDNVRLWDPAAKFTGNSFQRLQGVRPFYQFGDIDVDRYTVNGKTTPVVVSARELSPADVPNAGTSWENRQVAYTHGFGAAMAPYSASTEEGDPVFAVSDVPVQTEAGAPKLTEPRVYFGDGLPGYVVVKTSRKEVDYVDPSGNTQTTTYAGTGGVKANSIFRRAAFALRFGDINPVISSLINNNSRFLYNRDIRLRVQTVAPFLKLDSDPYPVIIDGRVKWIMDAYTTTDRYPYATPANTTTLDSGSGLGTTSFNYVRNSVKVTVDADNGTTTLYVSDKSDPIVRTWEKAFPDLFASEKMPAELQSHVRYPEEIFRVQSAMWSDFHITKAQEFYAKSDAWNLAQDPASVGADSIGTREQRMAPYYVYMQVPGESSPSFVLMQSFVPESSDDKRRELVSFMIAKMDGDDYGKLVSFELPRENLPNGPADIAQRIQSDPTIARDQSLLNSGQSQALQGNLLVIPIKNSFLYVQPWYVQGRSNQGGSVPLPQLKRVAVVYGNHVAFRDTFQQALADVFGGTIDINNGQQTPTSQQTNSGSTNTSTTSSNNTNANASELLAKASDAYAAAQQALKDGNLGLYKQKNDEAAALIKQAQEALG